MTGHTLREFERALDGDRLADAATVATNLDLGATSSDDLLADFVSEVQNGAYDTARTVTQELNIHYESRSVDERTAASRSLAVVNTADLSAAERQSIHDFLSKRSEVQLTRSEFLLRAVEYLSDPTNGTDSTVVSKADSLATAEQTADQRESEATTVADDEQVPGTLELAGITTASERIGINGDVTATIAVANVGDSGVDNVQVAVTTESGLSASGSPIDLGTVAGRTTVEVDVLVNAVSAGTWTTTFDVSGANVTTVSGSAPVTVEPAQLSVGEALSTQAGVLTTPAIQRGVGYWANDDTVPGTNGETIPTDRIQTLIKHWRDGQPIGGGNP